MSDSKISALYWKGKFRIHTYFLEAGPPGKGKRTEHSCWTSARENIPSWTRIQNVNCFCLVECQMDVFSSDSQRFELHLCLSVIIIPKENWNLWEQSAHHQMTRLLSDVSAQTFFQVRFTGWQIVHAESGRDHQLMKHCIKYVAWKTTRNGKHKRWQQGHTTKQNVQVLSVDLTNKAHYQEPWCVILSLLWLGFTHKVKFPPNRISIGNPASPALTRKQQQNTHSVLWHFCSCMLTSDEVPTWHVNH